MRKLLFITFALILLLTTKPDTIYACSCMAPGSTTDALNQATAVFSGQVVKVESPTISTTSADPVKVTFQTDKVWKGDVSSTVVIETPISSASCGYNFEMGHEYLVFSNVYENGAYMVYLCGNTQEFSDAEVAGVIDELSTPVITHDSKVDQQSNLKYIVPIVGVSTIILAILIVKLLPQKHQKNSV